MTEDYFRRALWNENIKISQSLSIEIVNNTYWWGEQKKLKRSRSTNAFFNCSFHLDNICLEASQRIIGSCHMFKAHV